MNHISVFSGIGGFDLAAEWAGFNNIAHCEINPFGSKILKYYWPNAESISDIKKHDFKKHNGTVDIISGGFPCQGFSLAGKRLGTDDDRYLWPEMLRAIKESKPTWVVGENVTGILSMEDKSGIWSEVFPVVESRTIVRYDKVDHYEAVYSRQAKMLVASICEDLEKEGYEVQPIAIPAGAIGAPHKRERIWFIAYSNSQPFSKNIKRTRGEQRPKGESIRCFVGSDGESRYVADADCSRFQEERSKQQTTGDQQCGKFHLNAAKSNNLNGNLSRLCTGRVPFVEKAGIWVNKNDGYANCAGSGQCNSTTVADEQRFGSWQHPTNWDSWPTQSPVCDGNDGFSARLDGITFSSWRNESIKGGGNAIVPHIAYQIFQGIKEVMES